MDNRAEKIQDSELEIMRALWHAGKPVPLMDLRHELASSRGWEDSTIKTLLRRLQDKGAVRLMSRGIYAAVVSEKEYRQWSIKSYISKVFDGSAKMLVASLVSAGELSEEDIHELSETFNAEGYHE